MRYFVFSNYINAWSLHKGLNKLGLKLECISKKESLLAISPLNPQKGDFLFFTEESNLLLYIKNDEFIFYPKILDENLLDNKYLFAEYLTSIDEEPVPYQNLTDRQICYPIYLKSKHSWRKGIKMPRGYILKSENDFKEAMTDIEHKKIPLDCFFFQKLLKSDIKNNISTCGFFNYNLSEQIILTTNKVLGDNEKIATGTIVKTVRNYEHLIDRTVNILGRMKYTGPFELEFFYEEEEQVFYVLELNPRFWMQHGIFVDYYDNIVIKKYLGLNTSTTILTNGEMRNIVWFNSIDFIKSILTLNINRVTIYLKYYYMSFAGKCLISIAPDYYTAFKNIAKSSIISVVRRFHR